MDRGSSLRAADRAYLQLRNDILSGLYPAGRRVGEAELAATVGVSRTPVREALGRLKADGLIELLPNQGARIPEWTISDLQEVYELRSIVESRAMGLACANASPDIIPELEALCDRMEQAVESPGGPDPSELTAANNEFHSLLLTQAGSERLISLTQSLTQLPLVIKTFHHYDAEALRRSMSHHREMVAALRAQDPDWGRSVMQAHILSARDVLLRAARASGADPSTPLNASSA